MPLHPLKSVATSWQSLQTQPSRRVGPGFLQRTPHFEAHRTPSNMAVTENLGRSTFSRSTPSYLAGSQTSRFATSHKRRQGRTQSNPVRSSSTASSCIGPSSCTASLPRDDAAARTHVRAAMVQSSAERCRSVPHAAVLRLAMSFVYVSPHRPYLLGGIEL